MKLLLDTHILLWALADDPRLRPQVRDILNEENSLLISAATIWEISIKRALGKLTLTGDAMQFARQAGCVPLPITWDHAEATGNLPPHHADPFDRLLIAQADIENAILVSEDAMFRKYDVTLF
jgi:PIN domain nuclease of toxin-antitoxin system